MVPSVTNDPRVPLQQKLAVWSFTLPPDTPKCMFLVVYCACVSCGVQTKIVVRMKAKEEILNLLIVSSLLLKARGKRQAFSLSNLPMATDKTSSTSWERSRPRRFVRLRTRIQLLDFASA